MQLTRFVSIGACRGNSREIRFDVLHEVWKVLALVTFCSSRVHVAMISVFKAMVCCEQVTYQQRIIYVGGHSFRDSPSLKQLFQDITEHLSPEDPDEALTGFLVCYDRFFVSILEVSCGL